VDECDMSFFDMMVTGAWSDDGVMRHLDDVGVKGNAKMVAFNVLSNRIRGVRRGGSSKAGGSSDEVKEEPRESASSLAIGMAFDKMSLGSVSLADIEDIKIAAMEKHAEAEGEAERAEIDGLYARTLRTHGVGAKLRKAKMGEDPEGAYKTGEGVIKLTASDACVAKKWTNEAVYLASYNAMVRQVTIDKKFFILKRLREMQEYAYRLPSAQRLPYLRRLWMDSETGIPASVDENALEITQTEWAESLTTGSKTANWATGDGDVSSEMAEMKKKLADTEARMAKMSASRPECFVCGETGHIGKMCRKKCDTCSTGDRIYLKYGPKCSCKKSE
jgi:hypothetical protein